MNAKLLPSPRPILLIRSIMVLGLLACYSSMHAARPDSLWKHRYYLTLTDKNNSVFSQDRPWEFLSERSIARRNKQHLRIDYTDVPVSTGHLATLRSMGARIVFTSKWLNSVTIYLKDSADIGPISQLDFVQSGRRLRGTKPAEGPKSEQRSMLFADQDYGTSLGQLQINNMEKLHELGATGKGKMLAIMDVGFHNIHIREAFAHMRNEGRLLPPHDVWGLAPDSILKYGDHGTYVMGCAVGYLPGKLIGSAPDVIALPIRTEHTQFEKSIEEIAWISGLEYADSFGADVVNSSLGYTRFDDDFESHVYTDLDGKTSPASRAAAMAMNKGIIVCNSAGNEGSKQFRYIGVPADAMNILTVGSVQLDRTKSPFSSFGPTADGRVKPDVMAMGSGSVTVRLDNDETSQASGTSFAAPLMAGMAAALWQLHPAATAAEVMDAIRRCSDRYEAPTEGYGYGIPDMLLAHAYLKFKESGNRGNMVLSLYPNPAKENLQLTVMGAARDAEATITITDMTGKVTLRLTKDWAGGGQPYAYSIPISTLATGVYTLTVANRHDVSSIRFVKL